MGLKLGIRPTHKAAGTGVSVRLVSALCIISFCFGVFVVNRFWIMPDPIKIDVNTLNVANHNSGELHTAFKCEKKEVSVEAGDILSQVSQTHDVIMTLDKTISSLEMQLASARSAKAVNKEGSPIVKKPGNDRFNERQKVFFVMGIITAFSSRKRRDSIRETWMPQGGDLRKLEKEKGIIIRFVIGHSSTPGGVLDRAIDAEDGKHKDFLLLNHVEGYHELSSKTQIYFSTAAAKWDADFYIKVDDDVHVNIGMVGSTLSRHRSKPRVYIGCMKSGPVLVQKGVKYHEPEYWKFGEEGNKYFRHATGQIYAISKDLATYISVNRHMLHRYANEDVSLGSWFIGLDVEHIDDRSLCCGTSPDPKHAEGQQPDTGAIEALKEQRKTRTEDEFARGHILNTLSDCLYDFYYNVQSPRELWEALEFKYKAEDEDCEWKAQAGNPCAASFDWSCSGICKSVERMVEVHQRCGEGDEAIWHTSF